jgi:hypothetical protein
VAASVAAPQLIGDASVPYPEGGEGAAQVVLELLVARDGSVSGSRVVSGEEPFASAALASAKGWHFEPALRGNEPVPARIRLEVAFEPEPPPTPPEARSATETPAGQAAERPAPAASATPSPSPESAGDDKAIEITVQGQRAADKKTLGRAEVRQMPGAFGDPYRAIEALPGVTPIASGLPYFFVRGAPPGNVGYFFDQISVPLLFHVAAGPGVIHPAFIDSVDLYSGGYPARFGRYAGGIVSGEPAEPEWRLRGEASIRLVDAGAFLEVPFADGRGSAMLAGRYSYTGLIISLLVPDASVGYWDYQGRISYQLSGDDTLTLFGFGSHDFLAAADNTGQQQSVLDLTFHRLSARYRHRLDADSAVALSTTVGLDRTGLGGDPNSTGPDPGDLRNRSLGARVDYERALSHDVHLKSGADILFSRYDVHINPTRGQDQNDRQRSLPTREEVSYPEPGLPQLVLNPVQDLEFQRNVNTVSTRFGSRDDWVTGAHVETAIDVGPRFTVTPGFRLDVYETGNTTTLAPEPRLSARVEATHDVSLIDAIGVAHQPPSAPIPVPGLGGVADEGLQTALHSSAGVEVKLPERVTASLTLYQNVIFDSTDVFGTVNLQRSDTQASALRDRTTNHSYGLELYAHRPLTEKLGGFVSYTLSNSTRSAGRLSGPSSFDRRHVLNLALAYHLGRRWRLGTRFVTYSGIPARVAYPEAAVDPPRTPWYYRIDWRLEKRWPIGQSGASWSLIFEVLNTTLHEEVVRSSCYAYGCSETPIGPVTIPSIGVEASF